VSRKREKQRENRRELARQLDVEKGEVPGELLAHARVSEPEVAPSLVLREVKRGLLARAKPSELRIEVHVVDTTGARLAQTLVFAGAATKSGDVALTRVSVEGEQQIRYTRPGTFVILASFAEGSSAPKIERDVRALAKLDGAHALDVDGELCAMGAVAIAAAHRVQTSVDVPVKSAHVDALVTLKVRL
jgi:hypothetical protein